MRSVFLTLSTALLFCLAFENTMGSDLLEKYKKAQFILCNQVLSFEEVEFEYLEHLYLMKGIVEAQERRGYREIPITDLIVLNLEKSVSNSLTRALYPEDHVKDKDFLIKLHSPPILQTELKNHGYEKLTSTEDFSLREGFVKIILYYQGNAKIPNHAIVQITDGWAKGYYLSQNGTAINQKVDVGILFSPKTPSIAKIFGKRTEIWVKEGSYKLNLKHLFKEEIKPDFPIDKEIDACQVLSCFIVCAGAAFMAF